MYKQSKISQLLKYFIIALMCSAAYPVLADIAPPDWRQQQSDKIWREKIRPTAFHERKIIEGAAALNMLEIKAPYRAEDATIVPLSVHTKIAQTAAEYIKKITLYLDKNPVPLVGVFEFTEHSGKADIALRVRVDDQSYIRAIAELNTGQLYMVKSFIRATGACSAPPPKSIADSFARMGKMKMKLLGKLSLDKPNLVQLKIKHPNITGLQPMKIGSRVRPPPHFISNLKVTFAGDLVFKALLTFSVSMDPSFRFYFKPEHKGVMTFTVSDTQNKSWTDKLQIGTS